MASIFQEWPRLPLYSFSNHCEVRFDLARVSPPRDTKVENGCSVAANRAPLLFGCCGARSQL